MIRFFSFIPRLFIFFCPCRCPLRVQRFFIVTTFSYFLRCIAEPDASRSFSPTTPLASASTPLERDLIVVYPHLQTNRVRNKRDRTASWGGALHRESGSALSVPCVFSSIAINYGYETGLPNIFSDEISVSDQLHLAAASSVTSSSLYSTIAHTLQDRTRATRRLFFLRSHAPETAAIGPFRNNFWSGTAYERVYARDANVDSGGTNVRVLTVISRRMILTFYKALFNECHTLSRPDPSHSFQPR